MIVATLTNEEKLKAEEIKLMLKNPTYRDLPTDESDERIEKLKQLRIRREQRQRAYEEEEQKRKEEEKAKHKLTEEELEKDMYWGFEAPSKRHHNPARTKEERKKEFERSERFSPENFYYRANKGVVMDKKAKKVLVELADSLDRKGLRKEAQMVDDILQNSIVQLKPSEACKIMDGKYVLHWNDEEHMFGPFESEEEAKLEAKKIEKAYPEEPKGWVVDQETAQRIMEIFPEDEDIYSIYSLGYMKRLFPKAF